MKPSFDFTSELTPWEAKPNVFFLHVPADIGAAIRDVPTPPRGFGSVAVEATVGSSTWNTSIFPNSNDEGFVLPVKVAVRRAEDIEPGDRVSATVQLV